MLPLLTSRNLCFPSDPLCVCGGCPKVRSELKALEEVSRQHKQQLRQSKADERMSRAIDELKDMYEPQ